MLWMVIIGYVRLLLVIEVYPWLWNVIIGYVWLLMVMDGDWMCSMIMDCD